MAMTDVSDLWLLLLLVAGQVQERLFSIQSEASTTIGLVCQCFRFRQLQQPPPFVFYEIF